MQEVIKRLQSLQELDVVIHGLKVELEEQPRRTIEIENRIQKKNEELNTLHGRLKNIETVKGDQEKVLFIEQEKLKKTRARLTGMNVRTGAYFANQREIEKVKKDNDALEADILESMQTIEGLSENIGKLEAELKELTVSLETVAAEVGRITSKLQAELDEKLGARKKLLIGIEAGVLALYERIQSHFPGTAVSRAMNEMCTGCYMFIPPQLYNEVQRDDKIITCPACHRILFFQTEEEAQAEAAGR